MKENEKIQRFINQLYTGNFVGVLVGFTVHTVNG